MRRKGRRYLPECPVCGKARFPTEWHANVALEKAQRSDDPRRTEQRVYGCPDCGGWHLTSKA